MGYNEHRRAYRVIPDGAHKHVVAQSVIFDEREIVERTRIFLTEYSDQANILRSLKVAVLGKSLIPPTSHLLHYSIEFHFLQSWVNISWNLHNHNSNGNIQQRSQF